MKQFEIMLINENDGTFCYKQLNAFDRKHLIAVLFYCSTIDIELQEFITHTTKITIREKVAKHELLHNN